MKTLAFTRPEERLESSISLAESIGFRVLAAPSLRIMEGDEQEFRRFEHGLSSNHYAAVVVTSVTAVDHTFERASDLDEMLSRLRDVMLIAIGRATRDRLREHGLDPLMPDEYTSTGLVEMFSHSLRGKCVCLLRSDKGSRVLNEGLINAGANIHEVHVYRLEPVRSSERMDMILAELKEGRVDALAFTSALSASTFIDIAEASLGKELLRERLIFTLVAAIGEPTAAQIEGSGYPVDLVSSKADFPMMLNEISLMLRSVSDNNITN